LRAPGHDRATFWRVHAPLTLLFLLAAAGTAPAPAAAQAADTGPHRCAAETLDIQGNRIWVDRKGTGNLTVVFESGFGNDSSVWSGIEPAVRAAGVQTFVYDRAGMGHSSINTAAPYSVDNDVHILATALNACAVSAPVIVVGHSYGGALALLLSAQDARVRGVVLLDAVVPGVWTPAEVAKNLEMMRAQYAEVREKAPELAKVAIPWAEAMPKSAERINALRVPEGLAVIDIVAEHGQDTEESTRAWHDAHRIFTAGHPNREYAVAPASSHKVMADQPELVKSEILRMIRRLETPSQPPAVIGR
jgi:pimeloyl-ACP methyl ester carboxylesterase